MLIPITPSTNETMAFNIYKKKKNAASEFCNDSAYFHMFCKKLSCFAVLPKKRLYMSANIKILNQNIISRKIGKLNQDKYLNIQKIINIIQKLIKNMLFAFEMHFNRKKSKIF